MMTTDHRPNGTGLSIPNGIETQVKTDANSDQNVSDEKTKNELADFETAISATGYGKFHILLLLSCMPGYWSTVFVVATISYTLTGAECDLKITLMDKGMLNSVAYIGMLSSAILWGYLSDTLGRKKVLVIALFLLALVEFVCSLSQTYWMFLVSKFFSGFLVNAPFAIFVTYLSEMHGTEIRARIVVVSGIFFSAAHIILPLIAWAIIPNNWDFNFNGRIDIHSWNIFMAVFAFPPLMSALAFIKIPESPKFLMSRGRNVEALKIFKYMYSVNTGNHPDTYPIRGLIDETNFANDSNVQKLRGFDALRNGFIQMKPLLTKQFRTWIMLLCLINSTCMFGANSMNLWFPQIAGLLDDYTAKHSESARFCDVLASMAKNTLASHDDQEQFVAECVKISTGMTTYVTSMVVGGSTVISYILGGMFINKIGKNSLLIFCFMLGVIAATILPFVSSNPVEVVALFSLYRCAVNTCMSALSTIIIDLFPTSLRTVAVAIFFMSGRVGTISGNIIFPALLRTGCESPFFTIAAVTFVSGSACIFLPKTTLKKMI